MKKEGKFMESLRNPVFVEKVKVYSDREYQRVLNS